jgi:hypothetical protein
LSKIDFDAEPALINSVAAGEEAKRPCAGMRLDGILARLLLPPRIF